MKKFIASFTALALSIGFFILPVSEAHAATATVNYLIVGGGGGGGGSTNSKSAGGGGGVVLSGTDAIALQTYPITVGNGGSGGNGTSGGAGSPSIFNAHTAVGGTGGGGDGEGPTNAGGAGGALNTGGGAGGAQQTTGGGGGGGGSFTSGGNGGTGNNNGGNGGDGISSSISGTATIYGGGGGGSNGGVGGAGGGGSVSVAGTANTGGGGGAGNWSGPDFATGQPGGSGIVVISYPTGSLAATGGTITTDGVGNTVHTFTTDGVFAVSAMAINITGSGTANRLPKFTGVTTLGDSLFSDDGSNMTLTSGNLFMQIGSLIDSVTGGALNFGTTNATTMTFGRSGQNAVFNSSVGIGTSTPGSLFSIGNVANFTTATTTFYGNGINLASGCFAVNGNCVGGGTIGVANGGTASTTPLGGILVGNGLNPVKSLIVGNGLAFDGATLSIPSGANCTSTVSPAVCGSAPSGSVAMSTGVSTLVVNTTAVTANSQIFVIQDSSLGARLGITCNTTANRVYSINARTPGVSFTIKSNANPNTNKACLSYWIVN